MVAADPNAGVIYVCNPNNPTGTVTPRADIEWALANKPAGSVLLVDEAYLHFEGSAPMTDLVAADKAQRPLPAPDKSRNSPKSRRRRVRFARVPR